MPKWFWVLISVVVSSGIYFSIRYGLRPKPISLMKPTIFSSMEELGAVTSRRLFQPLRSEKVIVLGYDAGMKDSLLMWQGLVKAARESKVNLQKVYYSGVQELPEYFKQFSPQVIDENSIPQLKQELISLRRRNGAILFIVPTESATHLRADSLTKKLEATAMGPVFSISQLPLVLDLENLEKLSSSCTDLDPSDYTSRLQCVTFKYAKSQLRRKMDPHQIQGAIERYGLKEYLTFVYLPQSESQ